MLYFYKFEANFQIKINKMPTGFSLLSVNGMCSVRRTDLAPAHIIVCLRVVLMNAKTG